MVTAVLHGSLSGPNLLEPLRRPCPPPPPRQGPIIPSSLQSLNPAAVPTGLPCPLQHTVAHCGTHRPDDAVPMSPVAAWPRVTSTSCTTAAHLPADTSVSPSNSHYFSLPPLAVPSVPSAVHLSTVFTVQFIIPHLPNSTIDVCYLPGPRYCLLSASVSELLAHAP